MIHKLSDNMKGAILMMCSMAAYTFNDACIKLIGPEMPIFQLMFLRGVTTTILIYLMARSFGKIRLNLPSRDWATIAFRTACEISTAYFFITALMHMPIANVTAILQVLPLTVTLGGALFFREVVGWRRLLAILVGFTGMLLIVRPGPDGFDVFGLYALAAVASITARDLATRRMSPDVPSMTVMMATSTGITMFSAIASLSETWVPITSGDAILLGGAALFIIGGYFFSVAVMRVGEVGFVAPFRYTSLVWALILGFVLFGDWPDGLTLFGACIVVSTGVFTLIRERKLKKFAG